MAVLVLIEDIEDVIGKFSWISEGEELLVYPTELGLVELSAGAILQESFVPNIEGNKHGEGIVKEGS